MCALLASAEYSEHQEQQGIDAVWAAGERVMVCVDGHARAQKPAQAGLAMMQVAQARNIDSIVIGHSRHGPLHELLRGSIVKCQLRMAGDIDVHLVADRNRRAQ